MSGPVVLGLDPGFASLGVAVVELHGDDEEVLALSLIRTEKEKAKRKVLASDDNVRRAREMTRELTEIIKLRPVIAIAAESMSFTRHASVSQKMGITWGVISAIAEISGMPIVQASPQRVKEVVCGAKNASKEEVEQALCARYADLPELLECPPSMREHPFDALAAVVAALDSEVVRLARKMAKVA